MNKSILLATIAVLLVAGCTAPSGVQWPFQQITTTTIGGNGLVITDFSPDSSTVTSGSSTRISFTITNAGGAVVPDASSLIYLTGSDISLTDASGVYWHSNTDTSQFKHFGKNMNPANSNTGTPADEKIISWSLIAPNVTKSQPDRNDIFIGRVYYDYQTTVAGTIWAYTQAESDSAKAGGRTLNKATFSSTSGPVALVAKISPDPVVGTDTFTLTIKVNNVGGGSLYKAGTSDVSYTPGSEKIALTSDDVNIATIDVSGPGITVGTGCSGDVTLPKGSNTVSCELTLTSPPATFQGYPITITATYGYYTERTTNVIVTGK
jgi:hypothetical protein